MKWWVIYKNLPLTTAVRLPHARSGNCQRQETFFAPSVDKQTRNYGTECLNHHSSLSALSSNGLSRSRMKWWGTYTNLSVIAISRLSHPQSRMNQGQQTLLAPFPDQEAHNYERDYSCHHPSLSIPRSKRLSHSKMKWWAVYTNVPVNAIVKLYHSWSGDRQDQQTFLTPSSNKLIRNYHKNFSNHHSFISTQRSKELSLRKMKWWIKYKYLPVNAILRLRHLSSREIQEQ